MIKTHAYLVLCHQPPYHIAKLAEQNPESNYYIHYDLKSPINQINFLRKYSNVYILDNRIKIYWGGFSQIQATLHLFEIAFANSNNGYFHLISGEDIVLQDFTMIERTWENEFNFAMMITCDTMAHYKYRFVMNSIQADTSWQRKIHGKVMTKAQQGLAKFLRYNNPIYFGSQWFSITRSEWEKILPFIEEYSNFFKRKLVPDEHFFQTLVKQKTDINIANDSRRLIIFDKKVNNGNSPIYLDLRQLRKAQQDGFWFARKVKSDVAMQWLREFK